MIAQYLAIDFPEMVEKLVLAVTTPRAGEPALGTLEQWSRLAEQGDYKALMIDTAEKTYSPKYLKRYRLLYPLLGRIGKPKSFDRFLAQAHACMHHNAYPQLNQITCPTLVIGGSCDQILGADASRDLADNIGTSELFLYEGLGHGLYEEAGDFQKRVQEFLAQ